MKSILFLVPHPVESSDYRYRIQQFVPYLERAGYRCHIWPFSTSSLFKALASRKKRVTKVTHMAYCTVRRVVQIADLSRFDLVVINREVFPFFTPLFEGWVLRHPRVVFSFDDAVYVGHHDVSKLNHPLLYRLKYRGEIDEVLRRSVHVLAGSPILANYAKKFNSQVSVLPTVLDCNEFTPRPVSDLNRPLTIGWIGSRSTYQYLSDIHPALQRLAREYPKKLRFSAFGFDGFTLDLPGFKAQPFRLNGEVDYLHSLDIGLMPLPDTEWCRGKCAFKAIQYMASGVATVASPVGITPDLIQHNVNGMLASSVEEWYEALKVLIDHADVRRRLTQAARRTIEASYSLQVWGPKLATLFQSLLGTEQAVRVPETITANS